jgi:hypothetical protein
MILLQTHMGGKSCKDNGFDVSVVHAQFQSIMVANYLR